MLYSIDASNCERLGKYVNDAPKKQANCVAKSKLLLGKPCVLLFAAKDIAANSQLLFDYGGKDLPWRKVRNALAFHSAD
jgi:hypothetical protein